MRDSLPIDEHVPEILEKARAHRAVVVVAPPGSGKTTRVAPAFAEDGKVLLLQPRRVAARALARRIAAERDWTIGEEVGWHVRFERRFGPSTQLLVATEGILTRRLQADPLLEGFRTVILDEFHERSLHADLGLALVRQASRARDDLVLVVMSATLAADTVSEFLGGCPVVEIEARPHPIEISYAPHLAPGAAIREVLRRDAGHVLYFLPGAPEIRRLADELRRAALPGAATNVLALHGSLGADEQDAALAPCAERKLILATNLAETSLTVEGVTDVVDSGLHKAMRRDEGLGIDRLEIERISADSAEQRAGRAGRTAPGRALRLWDARDRLRAHREPEIQRVDLAGPVLDVLAWGANPETFEWFEPPPADRLSAALELLGLLGAVSDGRITEIGRSLHRLAVHPRLARVLLDAGGSYAAAAACAAIAEGWRPRSTEEATASDALTLADRIDQAPQRVRRAADALARDVRRIVRDDAAFPRSDDTRLLRAFLAGYPDRVAKRREAGSTRLLLSSGHGAVLAPESDVRDAEYLVTLDIVGGRRGGVSEARVRMASRIDPAWVEPTEVSVEHRFDASSASVRATERTLHGALVLAERPVAPDPEVAARLLGDVLVERGPRPDDASLVRRLSFAEISIDLESVLRSACLGRTTLPKPKLSELLPRTSLRDLGRLAPESVTVPSGRRIRLDYRDDGTVHAAVKLQELFGWAETPRIGARGEPLTLSLLAPNGRPVQTTRDLRSFWERTYPEVRKELRGRYSKHPWPEDPWTATPTARAKRGRT